MLATVANMHCKLSVLVGFMHTRECNPCLCMQGPIYICADNSDIMGPMVVLREYLKVIEDVTHLLRRIVTDYITNHPCNSESAIRFKAMALCLYPICHLLT